MSSALEFVKEAGTFGDIKRYAKHLGGEFKKAWQLSNTRPQGLGQAMTQAKRYGTGGSPEQRAINSKAFRSPKAPAAAPATKPTSAPKSPGLVKKFLQGGSPAQAGTK